MKEKAKTVYYCDFCKKKGLSKSAMVWHEQICFHNPANKRPCFGCNFLVKRETIIYHDNPMGGEIEEKVNLFKCIKHDSFLYPPQAWIRKNWKETGNDESMPKECEDYKEKEY